MTTPRKSLTDLQRARLYYAQGGVCAECKRKIRSGEKWDIGLKAEADHKESLENGGSNEVENYQLLCAICHGAKTPQDRAKAAKVRRKATRYLVPEAHRAKSKLSKKPGMKYDWRQGRYRPVERDWGEE